MLDLPSGTALPARQGLQSSSAMGEWTTERCDRGAEIAGLLDSRQGMRARSTSHRGDRKTKEALPTRNVPLRGQAKATLGSVPCAPLCPGNRKIGDDVCEQCDQPAWQQSRAASCAAHAPAPATCISAYAENIDINSQAEKHPCPGNPLAIMLTYSMELSQAELT